MGALTYEQLSARLAQGKLGGSYFLEGEDPFLRDEAITRLVEAHLEGGSPDFDLDQLNGDEADAASLAARLDTPPMISPFRVVIIRAAQSLSPSARGVLEEAIGREVSNRLLIVAAEVPRGSKAKFYDRLRKGCAMVSLATPGPSELPGWVAKRARLVHGLELDMRAAQLLASGIGGRLGALARELEKLADFVAPETRIDLEQVRAAVGALPEVDRWQWIDKVVERRIGEALAELPALLDSSESAVGLIGAVAEALIRVGLARGGQTVLTDVLKRDGSYRNLSWKVRVYKRQARGWTDEELAGALAELLRADRLIKSGGLSDRAALEEALLRIGTQNGSPAGSGVGGSGGGRGKARTKQR
ncbi:MAG: DNA polymerase III subunit delta [Gemmatimonadales bacterium]|jgi:DNA polymerase III delta subunit